jgi:hypothetical protein
MSAHRPRPHDPRACPKSGPAASKLSAAGRSPSRPLRLRHLREHTVALVIAMLALIALPPVLVTPSGEVELVATGVLTLFACVLVAVICYESLRR